MANVWLYKGANWGWAIVRHVDMGDEPESDAYDEDDIDDIVEDPEVLDIDHLIDDLEVRAQQARAARDEPAWRRLEKYLEEKRCREDTADFEDFEL